MSKTFTVDEAQVLLPVLGSLLERARGMVLKAGEIDLEMQTLSQRIYLSGGMMVDVVAAARRVPRRLRPRTFRPRATTPIRSSPSSRAPSSGNTFPQSCVATMHRPTLPSDRARPAT